MNVSHFMRESNSGRNAYGDRANNDTKYVCSEEKVVRLAAENSDRKQPENVKCDQGDYAPYVKRNAELSCECSFENPPVHYQRRSG